MTIRKHCYNCKHYKHSFGSCPEGYVFISDNLESCLGVKYGICEKGNNETMKKWWDNNSNLPENKAEELPCYQATDIDAALAHLIETCDELINKDK